MVILVGAIDSRTKLYTRPTQAKKNHPYICPECNGDVIFKKGEKRIAYFSHLSRKQCSHYDHPSESEIHKEAKFLIKQCLDTYPMTIIRRCPQCRSMIENIIPKIDPLQKQVAVLEHSFDFNGTRKQADVAFLEDDKIKYIFEIFHTHRTQEKDRPEPWFELSGLGVIDAVNRYPDDGLCLDDMRTADCLKCHLKREEAELLIKQKAEELIRQKELKKELKREQERVRQEELKRKYENIERILLEQHKQDEENRKELERIRQEDYRQSAELHRIRQEELRLEECRLKVENERIRQEEKEKKEIETINNNPTPRVILLTCGCFKEPTDVYYVLNSDPYPIHNIHRVKVICSKCKAYVKWINLFQYNLILKK